MTRFPSLGPLQRAAVATLLCALVAASFATFAAVSGQDAATASDIDWLQLNMGLFGGLALFLAGLEVLSEGLKKAAGNALRDVLAKLTVNRFMGALTGAFVTGVLNSSSVTTVLVVGFVTAGVMTLTQSVGVIMGANIGSTVTAQILAFNVAAYSLIPVALGFFMFFASKNDRTRYIGLMIMGLGLVFYGMGLMSDAMKPLRTYEPFMEILARMENPLLGILAGALFTGLVQSSAATVGIAIAMASEGLLTLPAGIALALGANIGTCVTALLAALGKPVEAVRAAVVHIAFNIAGVVIWLPFLGLLAEAAVAVSPMAPELAGNARLAAEVPRQIANANTLFNVMNTLIFIGFAPWFARLAVRLVPERAPSDLVIIEPKYLNDQALEVPSIALENARREIGRAGNLAVEMMDDLGRAFEAHDAEQVDVALRRRDAVSVLSGDIVKYLARVRQSNLTEKEGATQEQLTLATSYLSGATEILANDIGALGKTYLSGDFEATSDETREMVQGLWASVRSALEHTARAIAGDDQRAAQDALLLQDDVKNLADGLFQRHAGRMRADDESYLERVRLLLTFIEKLRQVYSLSKRIARGQLPAEVARGSA